MSEFNVGDKVVHVGGRSGSACPNRGLVLTILDGPYKIMGWAGLRYVVDGGVLVDGKTIRHANAAHLLRLRVAESLGVVKS